MKTTTYIINLVHYHIFLIVRALNNSFNSLFLPLFRSRFIRRRGRKFGIEDTYEWEKERMESENDPAQGIVGTHSSNLLSGWISMLEMGIAIILIKVFNPNLLGVLFSPKLKIVVIGCLLAVNLFIMWIFTDRNRQYLAYFRYFEKLDNKAKWKNCLLACLFLLLGFGLFVFSLLL